MKSLPKAGLRHEGCLRGVIFIGGEYLDSEVYGIVRADWLAARVPALAC